jgi:hypothetical protein
MAQWNNVRRTTMRVLAYSVAAIGLMVSVAHAGPLAPESAIGGLEFRAEYLNTLHVLLSEGDVIDAYDIVPVVDTGAPTTAAGTFEFKAIELGNPLTASFVLQVGSGNNGVEFNFAYDRSLVVDPAFAAGSQTGFLKAVITDTTDASFEVTGSGASAQQFWSVSGSLLFSDVGGTYDNGIVGYWSIGGTLSSGDTPVSFEFVIGAAGPSPVTNSTPEPAVVGLIGAGLLGLGIAARRRR